MLPGSIDLCIYLIFNSIISNLPFSMVIKFRRTQLEYILTFRSKINKNYSAYEFDTIETYTVISYTLL